MSQTNNNTDDVLNYAEIKAFKKCVLQHIRSEPRSNQGDVPNKVWESSYSEGKSLIEAILRKTKKYEQAITINQRFADVFGIYTEFDKLSFEESIPLRAINNNDLLGSPLLIDPVEIEKVIACACYGGFDYARVGGLIEPVQDETELCKGFSIKLTENFLGKEALIATQQVMHDFAFVLNIPQTMIGMGRLTLSIGDSDIENASQYMTLFTQNESFAYQWMKFVDESLAKVISEKSGVGTDKYASTMFHQDISDKVNYKNVPQIFKKIREIAELVSPYRFQKTEYLMKSIEADVKNGRPNTQAFTPNMIARAFEQYVDAKATAANVSNNLMVATGAQKDRLVYPVSEINSFTGLFDDLLSYFRP